MQFVIAIGDWSDDGHGQSREYTCETDAEDIRLVREAFFQIESKFGIDLAKVMGEYEEYRMKDWEAGLLIELGVLEEEALEDFDPRDFAQLVVKLLNKVEPRLNVSIIPQERELETLHFYGYDEHHRHINFLGYGLFN